MSELVRVLNGHPERGERLADWLGLFLATAVITGVTAVLGG